MTDILLASEADIARARTDPAFRHQLLAESLDLLLAHLNKLRNARETGLHTAQIREGVQMAVRVADLLQKIANEQAQSAARENTSAA